MISYGIMQGRLTPSLGRGIQFFPFDNWENEFYTGKEININEIEWIFDYQRYEDNPLWTENGVKKVITIMEETGIRIRSICFDYFMRRPFFKFEGEKRHNVREENIFVLKKVLMSMKEIGATLIEIPFVDDSSIQSNDEREKVLLFLQDVLSIAKPLGIMVGCETDMPVGVFRDFLDDIGDDDIFANYDSGNSSGLGYDHEKEILSLSNYISNVHIKDRQLHGTTMKLGTGSADFEKVFSSLKKINYGKSIILQAARGEDGKEKNNIIDQITFVKEYCIRFGLEA